MHGKSGFVYPDPMEIPWKSYGTPMEMLGNAGKSHGNSGNPMEMLENPMEMLGNPMEMLENPMEMLGNPIVSARSSHPLVAVAVAPAQRASASHPPRLCRPAP